MYVLELALLLGCAAVIAPHALMRGGLMPGWTLALPALLLAADLLIGGARLVLLPAYIAAAILLSLSLLRLGGDAQPVSLGAWCSLVLLGVSAALELGRLGAAPPAPSGPFTVIEETSAALSGPVTTVRLWFPQAKPLTPAQFPLLIAMPGWDGQRVENEVLMRELASHGFVVAAVQYASASASGSGGPMPDFVSAPSYAEAVARAEQLTRQRARDAIQLLDRAAATATKLPQGVDLHRIGIFGFSLGGAVAAQACWLDPRFQAAVNLDGWHFAEAAEYGIRQPYLVLSDDTPLPSEADQLADNPARRFSAIQSRLDYQRMVRNFQRYGGTYVRIAGTRHLNFTERALHPLLLPSADIGSIDPLRALQVVNAYVVAFFQAHLAGTGSKLLSGDSAAMPEAHVQVWHGRMAATAVPALTTVLR
jgi:dienelactone hydrolase